MTMQGIQWDANKSSLDLITLPIPTNPAPGHVIIKVAYAGVCGSDLHIIQKELPAAEKLILGHEFGGTVTEVGANVTFVGSGDKVMVNPSSACGSCRFCVRGQPNYCLKLEFVGVTQSGGWTEYYEVPAEQVVKVPSEMTAQAAVLCEPYSCIINGYKKFGATPVDAQILVQGAGIIGLLWQSMLHYHGYRDVTVSEISEERKQIANGLGLRSKVLGPDDLAARFAEEDADVEGFDIIIDCTGVPQAVAKATPLLRRGGKLNVFGCCPGKSEMSINPADIMLKEITIFGTLVSLYSFPAATSLVHNMAANNYLGYDKLGIEIFKLEEYQKALDELKAGRISKAVFRIGGDW